MTNKVYVIADLHFGHKKLAEVRGFKSVKDHDDFLVYNWNDRVFKKDTVYILGDIFKLDRLPELNGTKKINSW